jgi:hypothetical protein
MTTLLMEILGAVGVFGGGVSVGLLLSPRLFDWVLKRQKNRRAIAESREWEARDKLRTHQLALMMENKRQATAWTGEQKP